MSSCRLHRGSRDVVEQGDVLDLTPGTLFQDAQKGVDLRRFGFSGFVSQEALAELRRQEERASRVLTTAATFAFR